jgi:hypothetical protein
MKIHALLLSSAVLVSSAYAQDAAPAAPTAPVWVKLQDTLNTSFTRAGDRFSAVTQQDSTFKGAPLPKGTRLTGHVLKAIKHDREHANAGLVLVFDAAVLKGGTNLPLHAMMVSLAPSHLDEIPKEDNASPAPFDRAMAAREAFFYKDGSNEGKGAAAKTTKVNGVEATSSIQGVYLFVAPDGGSSGVIVGIEGNDLELQKWTRMKVALTTP